MGSRRVRGGRRGGRRGGLGVLTAVALIAGGCDDGDGGAVETSPSMANPPDASGVSSLPTATSLPTVERPASAGETVPPPVTSFSTIVLQQGLPPAAPMVGEPTWGDRLATAADPAGDGDPSRIVVVAFTAPESWYRTDGATVFAWADGEGPMFGYSTGAFGRVEPFEFPVDPTKSSVLEIWLVSDNQSDIGRRLLALEVGPDDVPERRRYRTIDPDLSIVDALTGLLPDGGNFLERA